MKAVANPVSSFTIQLLIGLHIPFIGAKPATINKQSLVVLYIFTLFEIQNILFYFYINNIYWLLLFEIQHIIF